MRADNRARRSKPVRRLVTFGESHTVGISATRSEDGWASILTLLIDRFQDEPVQLVNRGIGADVLSKACPIYEEYRGRRPIGIERYERHVIEEQPDLVVISFGYNDMRAGTPIDAFEADLRTVIGDIQKTDALVLLMDTYAIPGAGHVGRTGGTVAGSAWDRGTPESQAAYNQMLANVAGSMDLVFARVFEAQDGAPWTFCSPDGTEDIHANDLGHRLIAHRVFEALATQCSFLSIKPQRDREQAGKSVWRYGENSREAALIADFYPDSPDVAQFRSG